MLRVKRLEKVGQEGTFVKIGPSCEFRLEFMLDYEVLT